MTYRISDISAASPNMSDEEFRALVEDIRVRGQLVPIWKSGDEIIDGRKRLRACEILKIEPKVVDVSDGQEPAAISLSLNILRTHYTTSQRAMFAESQATATQAEGRQRRSPNLDFKQKTLREAARAAGVSRSSVSQARAIRRAAVPEVVEAIEDGSLTLGAAAQITRAVSKSEQPAAVAEVVGASRGKRRQLAARVLGKTNGFHRSPKRALHIRVERGLDQLDNAVDALGRALVEPAAKAHREIRAWIRQITKARDGLSKIIRAHKEAV